VALAWLLLHPAATSAEDKPLIGHWRYFPVAHGTPEEPVPPDSELLKVVPPMRPMPTFPEGAQALGVALWWADHGQLLFSEQPPTPADLRRRPETRTPPGEDEPLVLCLWGLADARTVTVAPKDPPFEVTVRKVEFAPRYLPTPYQGVKVEAGRVVGFATYMPESGYGEVTKGQNTVFWVNVPVPTGTAPGVYEVPLNVIVHQVKAFDITARVEVLPFELPRADIAYGMYFRPLAQVDPRYRKPPLMKAYWRDMARHGMTSATHYMYTRSGQFTDKEGNLKADLDAHESMRTLRDMQQAGLIHNDVPMMLLSSDLNKFPEGAKAVQEQMKKHGLPELLYYGPDEPAVNEEMRAAFESLQPVRSAMRIVTAISDHAAEAYADLFDVWVVHAGRLTRKIHSLAKQKSAELWTYDCNHRGRGNTTRARFYAGLFTWALELKGNFHWCYTEHYAWEGNRNAIFNFVLPSDSGPVPSLAWEARREGVEDYRLLLLLEARIAAKPDAAAAQKAKEYLGELRGRVNWNLIEGMPKSIYPWDGAEVHPMCPDFEPAELSQIRARVVDHILALGAVGG